MKSQYYSWQLPIAEVTRLGPILLQRMQKSWPNAFDDPKPLKLGIRRDLVAASVSEQDADVFMSWYTRTLGYLRTQVEGALRFDLQGQPCGEVSADNARFAEQELEAQRYAAFRSNLLGDGRG